MQDTLPQGSQSSSRRPGPVSAVFLCAYTLGMSFWLGVVIAVVLVLISGVAWQVASARKAGQSLSQKNYCVFCGSTDNKIAKEHVDSSHNILPRANTESRYCQGSLGSLSLYVGGLSEITMNRSSGQLAQV